MQPFRLDLDIDLSQPGNPNKHPMPIGVTVIAQSKMHTAIMRIVSMAVPFHEFVGLKLLERTLPADG